MLGGVPEIPEDYQQFLKTGQIPLPPSYYSSFIKLYPELQGYVFPAGSDNSDLAEIIKYLVQHYDSASGERLICDVCCV